MKRFRRALPPYVVEDVARATGQVRLYYRRPGRSKIRIWPSVEQDGFWPAYEAAKRGEQLPKPEAPSKRRPSGVRTFETLCKDYFQSADFEQLSTNGQRARISTLKRCWEEETKVGSGLRIGDTPLHEFGSDHVKALRDRKRDLPEAANNRVKAIRGVFKWHLAGKRGVPNPCEGFDKLKPKNAHGFHSWTIDEVERYEATHPVGTNARLAFDLAFYTTQRKSDVVRLGPVHVRFVGGLPWLSFTQAKTGALVEIPIVEPLAESIAARADVNSEAFLTTSFGKPYSPAGMGIRFRGWCDEAGLPKCAMHGLRKAQASRLAELGVDELAIGAITGHGPGSRELAIYTRAARRRLLASAAMEKLAASLRSRAAISSEATPIPGNGLSHVISEDA